MTLDLATLPIFPCRASDKSPLTTRGFYDARVGADYSRWPLVGVRTGAASGIDVLDIDPGALEWLAENEHRMPETRRHRTRRGGVHLLFQHAPGLRKSESKIARDVDVRADGGYAIWWPLAGLPVIDLPLAAWPGWLLPMAMGGRVRMRSREGNKPSGAQAHAPMRRARDEGSTLNFRARVKAILRKVEQAPKGNRNATLFWASCRLAEVVAEGKLRVDVATGLLECGCRINELWRDPEDGPERCRATIASAFHNVEQGLVSEA